VPQNQYKRKEALWQEKKKSRALDPLPAGSQKKLEEKEAR
jgi:hypothetical protein